MNIGFDVDGVIVNTEDMFRAYAEIYDIENVSVIDVAIEENSPYNVSFVKNIVIFAFGGIVIAMAIIFVGMLVDNTVKNQDEVERLLGVPVIAVIPKMEQ